ncbi:MAG: DUF2147 domain-containing protein [Bradyrhizobium sp.]|nr:DUF2147 domain-containing protein [Bradyrhizobium sp.]
MTRSTLTIFRIVAVMSLGALDANAAQPAEVVGVWLNPQGTTRVRISPCGAALCGTIVWLQTSNDPQTGEPLTDRNNPDPANRNRPILGMQILTDVKPGRTAGEWTGKFYAPNDGKIHDATLSMDGPNAIKLEGCMIGGLICRTRTWTRVN